MSKFLYYTRSNGDIDSRPNNSNLDTAKKRRDEIGDQGASRFSVQDAVLYAKWDGSKYITDSSKVQDEIKKLADTLHDEIEKNILIEANQRVYNFTPQSVAKFGLKLLSSNPESIIKWTAYDNVEHDHTYEQAGAIFQAGEAFLYSLHRAKIADKAGDGSLSNLNAIKDAQDVLK